jgi:hypothetical protein
MPLKVSSELKQFLGREGRGARRTSQLARSQQASDDCGRRRAKTEALRDLVPAVNGESGRLRTDSRECCPHGPHDQIPFTAPDLTRTCTGYLHVEPGRLHRSLDGVMQGQREAK